MLSVWLHHLRSGTTVDPADLDTKVANGSHVSRNDDGVSFQISEWNGLIQAGGGLKRPEASCVDQTNCDGAPDSTFLLASIAPSCRPRTDSLSSYPALDTSPANGLQPSCTSHPPWVLAHRFCTIFVPNLTLLFQALPAALLGWVLGRQTSRQGTSSYALMAYTGQWESSQHRYRPRHLCPRPQCCLTHPLQALSCPPLPVVLPPGGVQPSGLNNGMKMRSTKRSLLATWPWPDPCSRCPLASLPELDIAIQCGQVSIHLQSIG